MASSGYWLDTGSPEYDYVRYQITASTAHLGIIEKLNIWKINNSELQYRYERRCNGMLKITSWFNAEYLDHENNLEQICMRGFHFDPSKGHGMEFPTGIIHIDDDNYIALDHCFLLVELGIGRSFVYDGNLTKALIPQGYDSLYLPEQPLDRNKDGKFSLQEYQSAATFDQRDSSQYNHRYFVADVNQVCPRYIVRFKLQPAKASSTSVIENIQAQLAGSGKPPINLQSLNYIDPITLLPPEQNEANTALLGASSPTPNLAAAFNPSFSTTGNNNNNTMNNFDTRKYVPIEKLYAQASEEINYLENDLSGQSKHQWIERQLSIIEEKVREINLNYVEIIDSIDHSIEQAKDKLQHFIREKLELCLSIEIELRRQLEQMSWYNNAITYELKKYQHYIVECHYHDGLKKYFMLEFLKLWKQHTLLKNGLNRLKPNELSIISNIHGDLRVSTECKLYIDPFYATNHHHDPNGPSATSGGLPTSASTIATSAERKLFQTIPNPQQDLSPSSSSVHETVHQFTQRAKSNEVYTLGQTIPMEKHIGQGQATTDDQSGKIFHASPIQTIIEQEMEMIQGLIQRESAKTHTGLRLPLSISRPFLPSHQLNLPYPSSTSALGQPNNGINMHSLIDLLKSSPVIQENQRKLMNSLASTLETNPDENINTIADLDDKRLRSSFMDNLPDLLGLGPDANFQNLNPTLATGEAKKSPPGSPKAPNNNTSTAQGKATKGKGATDTPANPFAGNTANNAQEFTLSAQDKEDLLTRITADQLKQFLQSSFPPWSNYQLTEFAKKKQNQLQVKFLVQEAKANPNAGSDGLHAFKKSKLLLEGERDLVFFSLPFFNKLPNITLIYSTIDHRRDLEELYSKTSKNRNPTLIIIRSGDYRFGAYLNQAPLPTSAWCGNPQCFLFSLSLNLKFPYHGRVGHEVSLTNDDDMTTNSLLNLQEPHAIFGTNEMLMIGNGDLVLDSKLVLGKSELEMSYGIGLSKKPSAVKGLDGVSSTNVEITKTILAGGFSFPISDLEVWSIQY